MKNVVFDIETNGLLHDTEEYSALSKVHCLVVRDLDTGAGISCTDDSPMYPDIREGLEILSNAEKLYGHNIIGFDIPALHKCYPNWSTNAQILDTLVMVRLRWAHVKEQDYARARAGRLPSHLIGWQSLEAWGHRLGVQKTDYTGWCEEQGISDPWAFWRPEMQTYCEDDVSVNEVLIEKIRNTGGIPQAAMEVEHDMAWYLTQQQRNGWPVDFEHAVRLQGELVQRRQELEEALVDQFGCWVEPKRRGGEIVEFTPKVNNSRYGYIEGATMTRIEIKEFNPASRDHIANRLQEVYGWEPKEYTPTGKPKVSDDILLGLDIPGTEKIKDYLTIDKRLGQLSEGSKAWLHMIEDDWDEGGALTGLPHIHHSCNATTITHRHRHSNPNLGQVPSIESEYGEECRAVFIVPPGWKMIGSDASGLEARCLAHYMARWDDGEYGQIILEGDVHTRNMEAISKVHEISRYDSKTFFYAYMYGAGDEKLGSIVVPGASSSRKRKVGAELRAAFEEEIPAMGSLVKGVKRKARKANYVNLIDGRRAYVRNDYAALNTLLQGTGAIICKYWIREFNSRLSERYGLDPVRQGGGGWLHPWAALGWIHDEVQIAVNTEKDDPEEVGQILVDSLESLTDYFDFRLPLTGDFMVGDNWSQTH